MGSRFYIMPPGAGANDLARAVPTLRAMLLVGASVFVTTLYVLGAVR
ncbi:hypothetical protein AA13595_0053 [Gluconacetobacter johannae DSM 13595]|uniref:Uncharacterized protein n=1 Tax=Gluconacetobacter johannae TaxID=112140 RepID=A0A7W4P4B4_9PROT|nr:hypothetical protein [Gluconacetobacter johannae]MBB2176744.1 hypothetical protein [Gluconacetobacter johannae]GBQ79539.1 hypothetical protein AA13595_0053 [Gluconacetobacter johannae DSM 13595]